MASILRLHTCVPDPQDPRGSHAWLSLEQNGQTTTYSLQGDRSPYVDGTDQAQPHTSTGERTELRRNCDAHWQGQGEVAREKTLTAQQLSQFEAWADQPHQYATRGNNCAHAARDGWKAATGEHFEVVHEQPSRFETGAVETFSCPAGLAQSCALAPPVTPLPDVRADFNRVAPPPPPPPPETAAGKGLTR
ncbi:MAG: hypothetical protein KF788_18610 [Piscinibacter sp.]|nr:hypothetical protein [Piscinibacter sp.]